MAKERASGSAGREARKLSRRRRYTLLHQRPTQYPCQSGGEFFQSAVLLVRDCIPPMHCTYDNKTILVIWSQEWSKRWKDLMGKKNWEGKNEAGGIAYHWVSFLPSSTILSRLGVYIVGCPKELRSPYPRSSRQWIRIILQQKIGKHEDTEEHSEEKM